MNLLATKYISHKHSKGRPKTSPSLRQVTPSPCGATGVRRNTADKAKNFVAGEPSQAPFSHFKINTGLPRLTRSSRGAAKETISIPSNITVEEKVPANEAENGTSTPKVVTKDQRKDNNFTSRGSLTET